MALEVLVRKPFIEISYDTEGKWIYANWLGFNTVRTVKEGCEDILQALKQYSSDRVLNDNTHVQGIWSGASEWVAVDWFPRMRDAGMKWFGWVYSPSVFSQLSTDKTLNHTNEGFVKTFYDYEHAAQWLRSV
ncbi:hypothetical protein [Adhaeribacter aquaticus]|uniref:hypothetical protein n=1 Tax=Adhaeribacter aquaticus TaxID=299567 RepID=UPI000558044D|nr:hypothetical protein [Adhaeribacter aquaticus]